MGTEDLHDPRGHRRCRGAPKVPGEPIVLEEGGGVGDVQPTPDTQPPRSNGHASVDEEDVGKGGLGEGGEVPRGGEVELGVLSDGLGVTPVPELLRDSEVVVSVAETVAVLNILQP